MKVASGAVVGATTAVTAFGASAVKTGASFDSAMSQVAATSGKTLDELNKEIGTVMVGTDEFTGNLRDFAQYMGSTTAFSATQAAEALNYMALAGYDVQTSMETLPSVLNLAAAGNMELATASDMVTDALSALGKGSEYAETLVDQMAVTSSKSNTSVSQLGEAILTVGATANQLAGGTTELNTALGLLANNGTKGAEGGTRLRNILLALGSPIDKAADLLDDLKVSAYDAEGNMRPLQDTIGDLNKAMADFTQEEKNKTLNNIFNKTDLADVNYLLTLQAEDWNNLSGEIDKSSGAAEKMANTQLDNLAGDITLFKSALEGAQIIVSDGLAPSLRDFVKFGTDGLSRLTAAFKDGGLSGAMDEFSTLLSEGLAMIIDKLPEMVNAGMKLLSALVQGITDNLPMLGSAALEIVSQLLDTFTSNITTALPNTITMIFDAIEGLLDNGGSFMEMGEQLLTALGDGIFNGWQIIEERLPEITEKFFGFLQSIATKFSESIPEFLPRILEFIQGIGDFLAEQAPNLIQMGFEVLSTLIEGIISAIPILVEKIPQIIITFADIINDNFPKIIMMGFELIGKLVMGIIQAIPTIIANLPKIIESIVKVIEAFNWLQLGSKIIKLFADGIKGMVGFVTDIVKGLKDNLIGTIKSLPEMFKDVGKNVVKGLWEGIKSMISWVKDNIFSFAGMIVDTAKSALGIHSPSTEFAYIGKMCVAGMDGELEDYNPYDTLNNSLKANAGSLQASVYGSTGNSVGISYSSMGDMVKNALKDMAVVIDGRTAGKLLAQPVDNALGSFALRRV